MTENSNTPADEFASVLEKIKACPKAREWADGMDYNTAWNTCQKPDWMFFLIRKSTPLTPIQNELLICRFTRETLHLSDDPRVLTCIETREAWIRGEVNDIVRETTIDSAGDAARDAMRDTAWAAAYAAAGATAWAASWPTAWAAAWAAAEAAGGAAEGTMKAKQCDIIRELIPQPVLSL